MANKTSNEETFKFIELYQAEECLWNPKNKYHKNKNIVNDSWTRIADSMGVPISELKKKKDNLLTTFRVNLKKKKASLQSGAGADEVYKPIWIFYDVMAAFLTNVYESTSVLNTEEKVKNTQPTVNEEENASSEQADTIPPEAKNNDVDVSDHPPTPTPQKPTQKRRAMNPPELQEANKQMTSAFSALNKALTQKEEDDCDLFCRMLAKQIKDFPKIEREEIMYEIHGVIMNKRRRQERIIESQRSFTASSPSHIILSRPGTSNSMYLSSTPSPGDYSLNSPQQPNNINILSSPQQPNGINILSSPQQPNGINILSHEIIAPPEIRSRDYYENFGNFTGE